MSTEPPAFPPHEPPEPPVPPNPPRPAFVSRIVGPSLEVLRSGWGRAAVVAGGVLLVLYVLALVLAWLQGEAISRFLPADALPTGDPTAVVGLGTRALFSLMLFHGVSLDARVAFPAGEVPFGLSIQVSAVLTLMLALAAAVYLLYMGGRWAARRDRPIGWLPGLRGLQIAGIYAVLAAVLAFIAGVDLPIPDVPGESLPTSISIGPSKIGAFGLPFLIAAVAAGAGALSGRLAPRERFGRLVLGGISGGWRAAWLAAALASMGFLVVAAFNPDETRAYLDLLPGGGLPRVLLVVSTLLVVPNMGVGIAAAAMGGSINLATNTDACAIISFLQFPGGVVDPIGATAGALECALPIDLGPAPFQYLLFLLVPLAATIAGGWLAAQRAGATEAEDGAMLGAAIALPYALGLWGLALLARVGGSTSFFVAVSEGWVGPGLVSTVLVAIVWGALGGAIGGALAVRNASGPGINPGPPTNV